jgi:hypothetical protein
VDSSGIAGSTPVAEIYVRNSHVSGNAAWASTSIDSSIEEPIANAFGGGIYGTSRDADSTSNIYLIQSTLDHNSANATAEESPRFDGNAYAIGGAVYFDAAGTLSIIDSTVSANLSFSDIPFQDNAEARGGGIAFLPTSPTAMLNVVQTTISGNTARALSQGDDAHAAGGGIMVGHSYAPFRGHADIISSTIAYNRVSAEAPDQKSAVASGLDVFILAGVDDSAVSLYQTLMAANVAQITETGLPGGDETITIDNRSAGGRFRDAGYNLIVEQSANAWLDTLAFNGGPTQTHALLPGSPAIDAGDPAFDPNTFDPPLSTDQRGQPRVLDGDGKASPRIDIGSYEYSPTFLFADLNGDGVVGLGDVAAIQSNFGINDARYSIVDLNDDEHVDAADVAILAQHFGRRAGCGGRVAWCRSTTLSRSGDRRCRPWRSSGCPPGPAAFVVGRVGRSGVGFGRRFAGGWREFGVVDDFDRAEGSAADWLRAINSGRRDWSVSKRVWCSVEAYRPLRRRDARH